MKFAIKIPSSLSSDDRSLYLSTLGSFRQGAQVLLFDSRPAAELHLETLINRDNALVVPVHDHFEAPRG